MFGPLMFENDSVKEVDLQTACLLCDDKFNVKTCLPLLLKHIFDSHSLVIENVQCINDLHAYITYWKEKFRDKPINEIIPAVSVLPSTTNYFVLSDLLQDDKRIRHQINLNQMLKTQEFERTDTHYKQPCLFCKLNFEGKRSEYLNHLLNDHNIRIGNPQNLVYVDDLINYIESKLESLQCLYCEKVFVDRTTLKEHMRKKQHKRINPSNKHYDKFFAVNYLNPDRNWHCVEREVDVRNGDVNSDDEYEDWHEPDIPIVCLMCPVKENNINKLCLHMTGKHGFNFYAFAQHLDFYQKVKLVNYIRKQVHNVTCFHCHEKFKDAAVLELHVNKAGHCLPDAKDFDQPEFYFPTYENDSFLLFLEDIED